MATVVTVHGTFAHIGGTADALNLAGDQTPQWWQTDSDFEKDMRTLLDAEDGRLDVVPFVWSAVNSETQRREAASKLLALLRSLDAKNEKYCVVGHSHGGSVISTALIESVARGKPLTGLQQWISVGTPFVGFQKELFLFSRLSMTRRVTFVASMMLLIMFLFVGIGQIFASGGVIPSEYQLIGFAFSAAMMSLPFIVFYILLLVLDRRELFSYGARTVRRAEEAYGPKWLGLAHKDDEAVQGLRSIPRVKLAVFDKGFAAPLLTKISVVILPLAYLLVVTSPSLMITLANTLKTKVYGVSDYQSAEGPVEGVLREMRRLRQDIRQKTDEANKSLVDHSRSDGLRQQADQTRQKLRELRRSLRQDFPESDNIQRALRFKTRFLERDGKPCEGETLCGGGRDFALNSQLLFHVVTDELSHALVSEDLGLGMYSGLLRVFLPIVLVPLIFGLLALAILWVIQRIATYASGLISRLLNHITLMELKRSALGNDTEGEIALGADLRPGWIARTYLPLPNDLGDKITAQSNDVTAQTLTKFRNAISTLAFSEGEDTKARAISNYFSWKELIHTTYFDVPQFRKLVAHAVSRADGFKPSEAFKADPEFAAAEQWLAGLEPPPPGAPPQAVPFPT